MVIPILEVIMLKAGLIFLNARFFFININFDMYKKS